MPTFSLYHFNLRSIYVLLCIVALIIPLSLLGQSQCIKINEIQIKPCCGITQQQTREFIEIFNHSYTDTIDLEGYWFRTDLNNNPLLPTFAQDSIVSWDARWPAIVPFDLIAGPLTLNSTKLPPRTLAIILQPNWNASPLSQLDIPDNSILLTGAVFLGWGGNGLNGVVPNALLFNAGDFLVLTHGHPANSNSPRIDSVAWPSSSFPNDVSLQRDDDCVFRWHNTLATSATGGHPRDADNSLLSNYSFGIHNFAFSDSVNTGGDTLCPGDSSTFYISNSYCQDSIQWNFGDPGSGTLNTSTSFSASHVYANPGTYPIELIVWNPCNPDTLLDTVFVFPYASLELGNDTLICPGDSITLNADPAGLYPGAQYTWSNGSTNQFVTIDSNAVLSVILDPPNSCVALDTIVISLSPFPLVDIGHDTLICIGESVLLNAGSIYFQYLWSNGLTSNTSNFGLTSNPSVTVVDSVGCFSSDTMSLTTINLPQISFNSVDVSCYGFGDGTAVAIVIGKSPFTYSWNTNPVQNTGGVSNLTPGQYSVSVADSIGCLDSAFVSIQQPDSLTLQFSSIDETCDGFNDGSIISFVSGGKMPYTYSWSSGQNSSSIAGLTAGQYILTVTDLNGCTIVKSVTINTVAPPSVQAGGNAIFCEGEGGDTINAVASGGVSPYYFTWWCDSSNTWCGLDSIFDDDPIASPTQSAWYYVQVIDGNGCPSNIDSTFVTVLPKPIVNAGPDIFICPFNAPCQLIQASISGAPGPFLTHWFPSLGLSNDSILNPCTRPDSTTIYTLIAVSINGCESNHTTVDTNSTVLVQVKPLPIANAGPDIDICLGESKVLNGVGSGAGNMYQYEWSPSTGLSSASFSSPLASPAITTIYTLVVWSNGCPSYGDSVTVNVHTNPTVQAGVVGFDSIEICHSEEAILSGIAFGDPLTPPGAYSFLWEPAIWISGSPNLATVSAYPDTTTTFYLTGTSAFGCENRDSLVVYVKPSPFAEAGANQIICIGDSIQLSGSVYYQNTLPANPSNIFYSWKPGTAISDSGISDPIVNPAVSTWYYLEVQYAECAHEDSVLIEVMPEINLQLAWDTNRICEGDTVQLFSNGGLGGATISWSPMTLVAGSDLANPFIFPSDTVVFKVKYEEGACVDSAEIQIDVIPKPALDFISSLREGCAPLVVSFMETSADALAFLWDFGDQSDVSNEQNPSHNYTVPGTYFASLSGANDGNCTSRIDDILIQVFDAPDANFESNIPFPIELILPNAKLELNSTSLNGNVLLWEMGDGNTAVGEDLIWNYADPGTYYITQMVVNESGCLDELTLGPVIISAPELFIPNVFTPNEDGSGDKFLISYSGNQPFQMEILDRWGVKHFSSKNKNEGWNGTTAYQKEAAAGVYYYHLSIGKQKYSGSFTLLR